jgi:hypothetical protein
MPISNYIQTDVYLLLKTCERFFARGEDKRVHCKYNVTGKSTLKNMQGETFD